MSFEFYSILKKLIEGGKSARTAILIEGDVAGVEHGGHGWILSGDRVLHGSLGATGDSVLKEACSTLSRRCPARSETIDPGSGPSRWLLELHEPEPRLLIAGAGHIGRSLAFLGHRLGFRVLVYDDRPDFLVPGRFPAGTTLVHGAWSDLAARVEPGDLDYAIIVTHAHSGDYDALMSLLPAATAYLGMIGSRTKVRKMFDKARAAGADEERLSEVFSPVGLAIGAETPEEIALSIMAEIVAVARGADPSRAGSCRYVGRKG